MHGFALIGPLLTDLASALARPELADIATFALGVVFAISGVAKARAPYAAGVAIANFGATRYPRAWLGSLLGLAELALGAALILDVARLAALAAASVLLTLFVYAMARMLRKGASFSCFCFGAPDETISRAGLMRATALAALSLALLTFAPAARNVGLTDLALEATAGTATVIVAMLAASVPGLVRVGQHRHGNVGA